MAILHVKTPSGVTKAYDLDKMGGIPVGFEYFSMNPNVPQGSLPLLGGEYNRATYPDLWTWVQSQTGYCKTESEWQTLSAANNGNVPFYSSGNGSTTFRVPSLKCWVKGASGVSEVDSYLAAGLPNITGYLESNPFTEIGNRSGLIGGGALRESDLGDASYVTAYQTKRMPLSIMLDASLSSSIYGNSTTVQTESIVGLWLVKAYGTIEETGSINEQQYIDEKFAQSKSYTDSKIITGTVQVYAGNTLPDGWLLCDGSAINRADYADLFIAIGTLYGAGDGSTTFNLPNLIDKFVQGNATSGTEHSAGLPNIVGTVEFGIPGQSSIPPFLSTGAFYQTYYNSGQVVQGNSYKSYSGNVRAGFDASLSSSIYGNSTTVQPPALTMRYIIKY